MLLVYESWVAGTQARNVARSAERGSKLLYVGEPTPDDKLNWMASRRLPMLQTEAEYNRANKTNECLQRLEEEILDLACLVANRLVNGIVFDCAADLAAIARRPVLSREDVARAVVVILGKEWFDLPCESGMPQAWKPLWLAYDVYEVDEILRRR